MERRAVISRGFCVETHLNDFKAINPNQPDTLRMAQELCTQCPELNECRKLIGSRAISLLARDHSRTPTPIVLAGEIITLRIPRPASAEARELPHDPLRALADLRRYFRGQSLHDPLPLTVSEQISDIQEAFKTENKKLAKEIGKDNFELGWTMITRMFATYCLELSSRQESPAAMPVADLLPIARAYFEDVKEFIHAGFPIPLNFAARHSPQSLFELVDKYTTEYELPPHVALTIMAYDWNFPEMSIEEYMRRAELYIRQYAHVPGIDKSVILQYIADNLENMIAHYQMSLRRLREDPRQSALDPQLLQQIALLRPLDQPAQRENLQHLWQLAKDLRDHAIIDSPLTRADIENLIVTLPFEECRILLYAYQLDWLFGKQKMPQSQTQFGSQVRCKDFVQYARERIFPRFKN